MNTPITIVASTNRPDARTHQVAELYRSLLAARGLDSELLSLTDLPSDFLTSDLYGQRSDAFRPLEARMQDTRLFVFVLPEYNGSFPGVAKAFIDALPRTALAGKYAALIGLGSGKFGNLRGLEHFGGVLNYCGVELMPFRAHLMHIDQRLDASTGEITHAPSLAELNTHADKLLALSRQVLAPVHG